MMTQWGYVNVCLVKEAIAGKNRLSQTVTKWFGGGALGMIYRARVENRVIRLPPEAKIPDGAEVQITFPGTEGEEPSFAERYANYVGVARGLPVDLAENHDHYLYGSPKK